MSHRSHARDISGRRREPLGRDYWRLLSASGLGNLGDGIAVVALPWYAATLTDDPFLVAAVGAATRLPWLLFALFAGVLGDRMDRRRLMVAAGSAKAVLLAALTAVIVWGVASIPLLVAVALLVGVCEVLFDNTTHSVLPAVVPSSRLERANGTLQGVERVLDRFVGAPLAGVLIAVSTALAFGAQAAFVLLAVVALCTLRGDFEPAKQTGPREPIRTMLARGLAWLWRHSMMRPLALVSGVANLASALTATILVLFARDVLDLGPQGYALLLTVSAAGAVLGSVLVPIITARVRTSTTLVLVLALQGLMAATMGLIHHVAVFTAAMFLLGFGGMWWNVTVVSLFQRVIPDALRSRVFSAHRMFSWGMLPLGTALGGALASLTEPALGRTLSLSAPYLLSSVISLVLAAIAAKVLTNRVIDRALADAGTRPGTP
ncbi:MFS transporter [Nocardiopsis oceani]